MRLPKLTGQRDADSQPARYVQKKTSLTMRGPTTFTHPGQSFTRSSSEMTHSGLAWTSNVIADTKVRPPNTCSVLVCGRTTGGEIWTYLAELLQISGLRAPAASHDFTRDFVGSLHH